MELGSSGRNLSAEAKLRLAQGSVVPDSLMVLVANFEVDWGLTSKS